MNTLRATTATVTAVAATVHFMSGNVFGGVLFTVSTVCWLAIIAINERNW